ncbi:hypothetical protein BX283_1747 [Streptomyces sp. TLI_146]|nr:hypothetical protein BX283_1747 [Streptomyces sp. TLI_146]
MGAGLFEEHLLTFELSLSDGVVRMQTHDASSLT